MHYDFELGERVILTLNKQGQCSSDGTNTYIDKEKIQAPPSAVRVSATIVKKYSCGCYRAQLNFKYQYPISFMVSPDMIKKIDHGVIGSFDNFYMDGG